MLYVKLAVWAYVIFFTGFNGHNRYQFATVDDVNDIWVLQVVSPNVFPFFLINRDNVVHQLRHADPHFVDSPLANGLLRIF